MFGLGMPELVLILVVALIVFGPGKLPQMGAALGKGLRDFKAALEGKDEAPSVARVEKPQPKAAVGAVPARSPVRPIAGADASAD